MDTSGENMAKYTNPKQRLLGKAGLLTRMATRVSNALLCMLTFCAVLGLSECVSTRRPTVADELKYQADIINAQNAVHNLARTVEQYDSAITGAISELEAIRAGAATLDGTIEQLAEQFDQYDRAVSEMVRKLREVQATASRTN